MKSEMVLYNLFLQSVLPEEAANMALPPQDLQKRGEAERTTQATREDSGAGDGDRDVQSGQGDFGEVRP